MENMVDVYSFFNNKKVLVTGHTGFKGSWLLIWLDMLGAEICGYALEPYTRSDNFVLSNIENRIDDDKSSWDCFGLHFRIISTRVIRMKRAMI